MGKPVWTTKKNLGGEGFGIHGFTIIDMLDDYFLVKFKNEEDYNYTFFEGPWMVAYHYLIVQR